MSFEWPSLLWLLLFVPALVGDYPLGQELWFVDAVARKNVELTMTEIHRRSTVLAELEPLARSRLSERCTTLKPVWWNSSVECDTLHRRLFAVSHELPPS